VTLPAMFPGTSTAYKDVFAFAVVIIFMAWRPTGLIAGEESGARVKRLFRSRLGFPRLASMTGITLYCVLFLHAETQSAVMGLTLGRGDRVALLGRYG